MHKIQDRPIAFAGKVEIRPMMYLALSYDHRLVDGREAVTFLVRVKECLEEPARLVLEWRNANFAPNERTEVEVLFEPAGGGTRVTVQHRGWAALRPDHPARHNLAGSAFSRMMGLWWGDQLTALRELAELLRSRA